MSEPTYIHFDPQALLQDLTGSQTALVAVLRSFAGWRKAIEAELVAATEARDPARLGRATHTVRGTLSQLHADRLVGMATEIEKRCRHHDAEAFVVTRADIAPLISGLKAVTAEVTHYLATH